MTRAPAEKEKALQMERIYVAVRARPLPPEESWSVPWQITGNSISLSNQSHKFEYDKIFGVDCKTKEVYDSGTKNIVTSAVSGFNGTVFAYGQTSSGKTHTMKGSYDEPGIIPLAIQDLFHAIQETEDREFLLRMSYMEIYNEEINDLLAPEHRKLQIHENIDRGIYVAGLKEEIVNCPEQVLELMKFGESHRHIGETNMNLYSSRSHTIFRMIIESREKMEDNELNDSCDAVRVSVLNLVDLAGSERVAKTGAEGKRLKEGSHINKSLLTLGSVIQKLSEGAQSQGGHVPYRDSKLTRILQSALGGNANTAIICNITLAQKHADETKSSLQFASKAKRVTNCVQVNEILTDAALLKRQKKEIEELRAKLMVSHNEQWEEQILTLRNTLLQSELEKERISLELEEEKKAKAQREERLLEQARKIENLSSLVLLSDRDEKNALSSKSQKKRRETWCPARSTPQLVAKDASGLQRASSGTTLLPFEALIEEDESCLDEFEDRDIDEIPFPEALSLLNVTSRRKISPMENIEETEYWSSAEKLNEQTGTPAKNTIQSLTLRESEAILVIKQLEDQIKLLELEKASIQNNLDNVLELATQQNNSFTRKYEEMQQEIIKAREEASIAEEKIPLENVDPIQNEVLEAVEGLALLVDQSKFSTDCLVSFVEELFQNFYILSKMLQDVKSSADGGILEFKSVLSEAEMLTIQLSAKAKEFNLEKSLLNNQLIGCQKEIEKFKLDTESHDKAMTDLKEQHELEKEEMFRQLLMMQNETEVLSSASLTCENESLRKELDRTKSKLKDNEAKLKNSIHEKTKLEGEKAQAGREIKQLISQRTLLERDIRKYESKSTAIAKKKEPTGAIDHNLLIREYQNLEMAAVEMEGEIASLEENMVNMIREKEEALTRLEIVSSELEEVSKMMSSAGSEIELLKDKVEQKEQKIKEAESSFKNLESVCASLQKEKEEMEMQLTDALLEAEAQKSTLLTKEKIFIEATDNIKISGLEIQRLSKDLSEAKLELEACKEEYRLLKRSSDEMISQLKMEKDNLMVDFTARVAKIHNDVEGQLVTMTQERDVLMCKNEKLCLAINEAEIHRKNSDCMISQLKMEKDKLAANITALEAKIHDDLECQLAALTKERDRLICKNEKLCLEINEAEILRKNSDFMVSQLKMKNDELMKAISSMETRVYDLECQFATIIKERDALMCTNEKLCLEINEAEVLRNNADRTVLHIKLERDELAARISAMEAKMHDDESRYNTELTKFQVRCRSLQEKLDTYKGRYGELHKEHNRMNEKFKEASDTLKNKLREYGLEILKLKKELANSKCNVCACASTSAQ
ncbi:P-loop containing nucleoside triphosphate hydrolases superfamily protein [Rhynchospora pubera]|uniref:P-loop containing nucleoside triphosphate hydrolases superfamily protein n=1 Tax=Rhynchospora pubera TaxID=906938 RepID=A0AAV8BSY5_9POAL|nr:P-loop containing nucleoside triphosphate hydrolases superfamily protein [Rhynchospora pubera]